MRNYLVSSDFYKKIFDKDPDFSDVELCSIQVVDSVVYFSLDIDGSLADHPPRAWKNIKFNTIQLRFTFLNFKKLYIDEFLASKKGIFNIFKLDDDGYSISFISEDLKITFDCEAIVISGVSAYLNSV